MKIDFICVGCSLLPLLSLRTRSYMLIVFCNGTTLKLDKIEILANRCNFKFLELGFFNFVLIWCISKKSNRSLTFFKENSYFPSSYAPRLSYDQKQIFVSPVFRGVL